MTDFLIILYVINNDHLNISIFKCQYLGVKVGDHDSTLHIALKLSITSHEETSKQTDNIENSIEDLQETLAVLDGFQCFYFGTHTLN